MMSDVWFAKAKGKQMYRDAGETERRKLTETLFLPCVLNDIKVASNQKCERNCVAPSP